jgi:hypothetical protein
MITPELTEFGPRSGPAGTWVALYGSGLTGADSVSIGGATAVIAEATNTEVRAIVPPAATAGDITVTTPYGV